MAAETNNFRQITCTTSGPKLKRQAIHLRPSGEFINLELETPERSNVNTPELSKIVGFIFSIDPFILQTCFTDESCNKFGKF